MLEGWIKLHRKTIQSEWFTDINTNHLFTYCILRANFENTKWKGVDIKRGSFITSFSTMSKETGLSVQQVRTSLSKLKSTSNLTSSPSNKYQVITMTKYDEYQETNKQPNNQVTNNQQTNNKQITTDKNEKNLKNEKKRKEICILGDLNWRRKRGSHLNVSEKKRLEDYESEHGDVTWSNEAEYKQLKKG